MKTITRLVGMNNGKAELLDGSLSDIKIMEPSILSIDGSTTRTGVGLLRERDGAISATMAFERENETPVQYKVRLKRQIKEMLYRNKNITTVYYEEPFIGYVTAISNLMMLRTLVEELIEENAPELDYIKLIEVSNMTWKKLFFDPEKIPSGSDNQKKLIYSKLISMAPFLDGITQDEADAVSMGFVAIAKMRDGLEDELKSKKKARAFQYESQFIGADSDDCMMQEFSDVYRGPEKILANGIKFIEIPSRANFDKQVYETMGAEDRVLILKFSSNHHGNVILANRLGHLSANFDYIYAVIWRKTRKY